jgi:glutamate dehydrogenase/leucine dehydrogenase
MNINIQKAFCVAALAVMLLLIMVLTFACSTTGLETIGSKAVVYPPPPSVKTREQQCREFGRYCEQERDGDHVR